MYDLSVPNAQPGACEKCKGTGTYSWGHRKSGTCFSCQGTGQQGRGQIKRNKAYNRYKVAKIVSADFAKGREDYLRDPGEDAADRWNETHS